MRGPTANAKETYILLSVKHSLLKVAYGIVKLLYKEAIILFWAMLQRALLFTLFGLLTSLYPPHQAVVLTQPDHSVRPYYY